MPSFHLVDPHHDGSELYVPNQAVEPGDEVDVFVRTHRGDDVRDVAVRFVVDGEPAFAAASVDREDGEWTWWRASVRAANSCTPYRFLLRGRSAYRWLTAGGVWDRDVTDAGDFRLLAGGTPPEWVRDAVVYQVFPDRFARGVAGREAPSWAMPQAWDDPVVARGPETPVQWYGGDLPGVEAHLDHLERVGANVLYLTPTFPARSNHRYDATSFDAIDPVLGGDTALASLVRAAHRRRMHVIGDLTTNHTGDAHEWFLAAQADASSEEAGFYLFDCHPDEYLSWLGVPSLPKLDWRSEALRRRLVTSEDSPVRRWIAGDDGMDGWRIDVANMTGRHGAVDVAHDIARLVRGAVTTTAADAWLVAEHMHDASLDLRMADGWHGAMNYTGFTRPVWSFFAPPVSESNWFFGQPGGAPRLLGESVAGAMREASGQMPWRALVNSMNMLDSHDTPRFRTHAGRDAQLAAAGLMYAWPGAPAVFAGQELGLEGVNGEDSRRPIPWDNASAWDSGALAAYGEYGRARAASEALRRGGLRWVSVGRDWLTFLRESTRERVLVHVSRSAHDAVTLSTSALGAASGETLFGDVLKADGSALVLPDGGPAVHAWRLVS